MRKKILSTFLTICMMLTLLPTMALAEDINVGNTGLNLSYNNAPSVKTTYIAGNGSIHGSLIPLP